MDLHIASRYRNLLFRAAEQVRSRFANEVTEPLSRLSAALPSSVARTVERLEAFGSLERPDDDQDLVLDEERWADILRAILAQHRLHIAMETEKKIALAFDEELIRQLREPLRNYDEIISQSWFRSGPRFMFPRLSDYVVMEHAERENVHLLDDGKDARRRQTDEKFHILQAPQHFIPDLNRHRAQCQVRNKACDVAFLDIDKFKRFNTAYTETVVDERVLPKFMRAVEGHVFSRGYAYRLGGDEYVLLLHNTEPSEAQQFVERLRLELESLKYPDVAHQTTVSIGLVHVTTDCYFTSREIEAKAATAKARAKRAGGNRTATYSDSCYQDIVVI